MLVKRDIGKTIYYTNYQYITNACACVESPHFLAWFVICFPHVIKTLKHGFHPYITFYMNCICSMILSACTHCNAMKRSIDICLL